MMRSGWALGLLAAVSVLVALMSLRVLVLPFDVAMPNMAHFALEKPLRLWGHLLGAPLALALAPLQLWTGLRRRWPGLHRWSGRLYGVAVLVGGLSAIGLAPTTQGSDFVRAGFVVLGVIWIISTGLGIWHARRGDLARHRWWMQRSLALTFAAITLRIIMAPLMASGWTVAETYEITAWGSWLLNLALLELWQRRRVRTKLAL